MSEERQPSASMERASITVPSLELLEKAALIPCGQPDTYGATPLDHSLAYTQQSELLERFQQLVDTANTDGIPENIVEYMRDTFAVRFHSRAHANHENYLSSLRKCEEFADHPIMSEMLSRAKTGHASPAELLLTRQALGIRSTELACLTHPYGERLEDLETMRESVKQSTELLGGQYFDEPETRFRVKGVVGEHRLSGDYSKGLFMTRKRTLGVMPDGTIIRERTSFVLRTDDEALFPLEVMRAFFSIDPSDPDWHDKMVAAGGLDAIAAQLLEENIFTQVIPISTTIYAFNPETESLIELRDMVAKELRNRENTPMLTHTLALKEALGKDVKDVGNMLYIGFEDEELGDTDSTDETTFTNGAR